MGTNYYLKYNECKCCNRFDQIHLGKSSGGWKFTFQTIENFELKLVDPAHVIADSEETITIESWKDLQKFLRMCVIDFKTARIVDEYGEPHSLEEFEKLVRDKFIDKNKSHYWEVKNDTRYPMDAERELIDEEGHSFSRTDFS